MPWKSSDAHRHTHKADTPHKQKVWARVANEALQNGHSDEGAIRIANSAVAKIKSRSKKEN